MASKPRQHNTASYKSGLEERVAKQLKAFGISGIYETMTIKFTQPEKRRSYTPDFPLPNGIIVETKGMLTADDRQKHLWIKQQHPELDIRFVFSNSKSKINKGSPTSYGDWATKSGFLYADKEIPEGWINGVHNDKTH